MARLCFVRSSGELSQIQDARQPYTLRSRRAAAVFVLRRVITPVQSTSSTSSVNDQPMCLQIITGHFRRLRYDLALTENLPPL
jgi:hypothetical protein